MSPKFLTNWLDGWWCHRLKWEEGEEEFGGEEQALFGPVKPVGCPEGRRQGEIGMEWRRKVGRINLQTGLSAPGLGVCLWFSMGLVLSPGALWKFKCIFEYQKY